MTNMYYVGSLWHFDCDPFVTVVGTDPVQVSAKLAELSQEETDYISSNSEEEANYDGSDIMTGGIFAESNYHDFVEPDRLDEAESDLEESGIFIG